MQAMTLQKRMPRRSRLFLPATVAGSSGTEQAVIRDVSQNGALLEASVPPTVETMIEITCETARVKARVAWVSATWFGVEFSRPLKSGPLLERAKPKLRVSAPRSYRRELLSSPDCGELEFDWVRKDPEPDCSGAGGKEVAGPAVGQVVKRKANRSKATARTISRA